MDKLNVAVVGCGFWGRNHARVYASLERASLIAVADLNQKTAKEIGETYNVDYYTDASRVFDRGDIEAVSICTPTVTHAKIALEAIEAGKHVLVEKPMTNTVEEADTLIKAAEKNDVKIAVGFVERFNPAVEKALEIVYQGDIGNVILAHARRVSRYPLRISDVGVVKDLAIHDVDIVRHLFDADPEMVYATVGSIAHEFEDYANIIIQFKDNRSAFIECNWLTPRKIRRLVLTGTDGLINVEYITQEITIENNEGLHQPFLENREPLKLELDNFLDSALKDIAPKASGEDGIKALKICDAALHSAEAGCPVKIDW